uniref:Myelin gene regulatory factor C-terminal domain-containing protein n=1 Tax=Zosterops lateralis melanops TaxID=1220523 RepID=A0A8D2QKS4_ZOSLA
SFYSALTIWSLYLLSIHDSRFEKHPVYRQVVKFISEFKLVESVINFSQSTQPISRIPEVNFCDILPCDKAYCCPIHQSKVKSLSYERNNLENRKWSQRINKPLFLIFLGIDTTVSSIQILETQQRIDHRHCSKNPQCSTTEPLIIFLCKVTFGNYCSYYSSSYLICLSFLTQGRQHVWALPVAKLFDSAYSFRVAVPGFASCSTDRYFAGIFFTDYYFYFYRQCN